MKPYDAEYKRENRKVFWQTVGYGFVGGLFTAWLQKEGIIPDGFLPQVIGVYASIAGMEKYFFKPRQAWNNVLRAQDALDANDLDGVAKYVNLAARQASAKTELGRRTRATVTEIGTKALQRFE
ncbi:MAG: hypothetical protein V1725_01930 [archaeon]